jgi:hypothetical protein
MLHTSRSKYTFNKHQSENVKPAIYFWNDTSKRGLLDPNLVRALGEAEAQIDRRQN